MNRWFGKKAPAVTVSFKGLHTDMHSHLIPGIDDGVKSLGAAVDLVRAMKELGFKKLLTTPHVMADLYRNSPETILEGLESLREAVRQAGIDMELEAAAEYKLDEGMKGLLDRGELLHFGDRHVLVELPYDTPPLHLHSQLFELQGAGYRPVLAHPERYSYWHGEFQVMEALKDQGILFQLNTISLSGFYSHPTKKMSEKLIHAGMIDYLGSDVHNMHYFKLLEKSMTEPALEKLLASGKLKNPLI
jgi:tyrosine-protein phosphatase YwqE